MKVKLGEIAVLINGDRGKNYPSQADIVPDGEVPFVNAGHLDGRNISYDDMNYISQQKYDQLNSGKFCEGDILYCLRGSLGKKAAVRDNVKGAIASSLVIIRPDAEKVDVDYLMFALDSPSIKDQLLKANNGSSQPNLSAASVRAYDIDLPEKKIQKEVVARLGKIRAIIDVRQQELQKLDELIKARFVELFGDLRRNSKEWDIKTFAELSYLITDGEHATPRRTAEGIYLLSARNVLNHSLQLEDVDYINQEEYDRIAKRVIPQEGDVLISCSGTVGRCCSVPVNIKFQMVRSVALIRFKEEINPVFAEYMITSDYLQEQINSSKTASSQANLFQGKIKALKGFVPPVELQEEFLKFIQQVDKSKVVV